MGAQSAEGEVDVLTFDVGGEREGECAFYQFGGFGAAEGAEGGVAFVGCGAGEVGVEDDFVLFIPSVSDSFTRGNWMKEGNLPQLLHHTPAQWHKHSPEYSDE